MAVWEGARMADLKGVGTLLRDKMQWPDRSHELVL